MAEDSSRKLDIRPVTGPARRRGNEPPAPPPPPEPPVSPPEPADELITGPVAVQFRSAGSLLAFLGSLTAAGASNGFRLRGNRGGWWLEAGLNWEAVSGLVWTAGGRPFAQRNRRWLPVSPSGRIERGAQAFPLSGWRNRSVADAVARAGLSPAHDVDVSSVAVLTAPQLGGMVLRKAVGLGLDASVTPVRRTRLGAAEDGTAGAVLLRLSGSGTIPRSLIRSLSDLPHTVVARWERDAQERLLVDIRFRSPVQARWLHSWMPERQWWVLSSADAGHWSIEQAGEELDGSTLLELPETEIIEVSSGTAAVAPSHIPVTLTDAAAAPTDAVLLDDRELSWAAAFFRARPDAEEAFVVPGEGVHLLLGSAASVPFGAPLTRVGPRGLYLPVDKAFHPPLSDGARLRLFPADEDHVIVVLPEGGRRFSLASLVPMWSLWAGDAPPIAEGLSPLGRKVVNRLGEAIRRAEREAWERQQAEAHPPGATPREDVPKLLKEAARQEARGNLAAAAEILERIGRPARAGRLYEQAARK